ncbi:MAG: GNAT family N-acetyltransferase [Burkholderiaceae bacterium]
MTDRPAVSLTLAGWDAQRALAQPIRHAVFVEEQHVPVELEYDDMDAVSLHAVALDGDGRALGTGRLLPDGHIGRMAVLSDARGRGIGGALLTALMEAARRRGDPEVVLHAQTHVLAFYRRYGFREEGAEFVEAGIPHRLMRHRFDERP